MVNALLLLVDCFSTGTLFFISLNRTSTWQTKKVVLIIFKDIISTHFPRVKYIFLGSNFALTFTGWLFFANDLGGFLLNWMHLEPLLIGKFSGKEYVFRGKKKTTTYWKLLYVLSFNCHTREIPQNLTHLFPVPVPLISTRTLPRTTFWKSYPYTLRTRHLISNSFRLLPRTRTPISKSARTLSVHYTHFGCVIGTESGFRLRTSGYVLQQAKEILKSDQNAPA